LLHLKASHVGVFQSGLKTDARDIITEVVLG
jgi:hypothetical protein